MKNKVILSASFIFILLLISFINNKTHTDSFKIYKVIKNFKIDNNISTKNRVSFKYKYFNSFLNLRQKEKIINNKSIRITFAMLTDRFRTNLLIGSYPAFNRCDGSQNIKYDIFVGNDKLVILNNFSETDPNFQKKVKQILKDFNEIEISIDLKKIIFFDNNQSFVNLE
jgi:hypothetical protein